MRTRGRRPTSDRPEFNRRPPTLCDVLVAETQSSEAGNCGCQEVTVRQVSVVVVATARQRALCRSLLHSHADLSIVGEGRTVVEAVTLTARFRPAVLILGSPPGRSGPRLALSMIRRQSLGTRVILLTAGLSADSMLDAIERGGRGWLDEADAYRFLSKAVRAVARGEAWLPRRVESQILEKVLKISPAQRASCVAPSFGKRGSAFRDSGDN